MRPQALWFKKSNPISSLSSTVYRFSNLVVWFDNSTRLNWSQTVWIVNHMAPLQDFASQQRLMSRRKATGTGVACWSWLWEFGRQHWPEFLWKSDFCQVCELVTFGGVHKWGYPQNMDGGLMVENPTIKMMTGGSHIYMETLISVSVDVCWCLLMSGVALGCYDALFSSRFRGAMTVQIRGSREARLDRKVDMKSMGITPSYGWFIRENPHLNEWWLGVPLFQETSRWISSKYV